MVGVMPSRSQRGSSPRGRGGRDRRGRPRERQGLIPARAGRSPRTRHRKTRPWAHPRAGGAVITTDTTREVARGSSPRGRGGPVPAPGRPRLQGLIPARAGRSNNARDSTVAAGAHPRAGGAVPLAAVRQILSVGSSPRGRGGQKTTPATRAGAGLIPARAGRSHAPGRSPHTFRAHPRAGGAVRSRLVPFARRGGSSPRGRGGHMLTRANGATVQVSASLSAATVPARVAPT